MRCICLTFFCPTIFTVANHDDCHVPAIANMNPQKEEAAQQPNNTNNSNHTAQWERQGEWLTKLRAHKEKLQQEGVEGWDLLEAMATLSLTHKVAIHQHRCQSCWHDPVHCICAQLKPLSLSTNTTTITENDIQLCILMHHKEYLCAGNSAKLLLKLLPNHTQLYLFGKKGEVDRLWEHVCDKNAMILWPSEAALSVADYQNSLSATTKKTIHAIVLDGTYTQARNMHKSLRKRWKDQLPQAVAVHPTCSSVFHRAQKNYGQAQLQAKADVLRVSTAEACGFLLTELGAPKSVLETIVQAVVVNNDALAFART